MKLRHLLIGPVLTFGLSGCWATARVHYQDANGGVLVLEGNQEKAMEKANMEMASHCGPANYHIVKRETVTVGREHYADSYATHDEQRDRATAERTQGSVDSQNDYGQTNTPRGTRGYDDSSTQYRQNSQGAESERTGGQAQQHSVQGERDVNEFRLHYACGRGGAVTGAAPAAAPPGGPPPAPPAAPAVPAH
jgi:hypothetical protein